MTKRKYPTCRTCRWLQRKPDPLRRAFRACENPKSMAEYIGYEKWQKWYAFGCIHHIERK